jgi:hypothetical protein
MEATNDVTWRKRPEGVRRPWMAIGHAGRNVRRAALFAPRAERDPSRSLDQEGFMRHWQAMLAVVAVAACADQPSTGPQRFAPSLSAIGSDGAPPLVYNTQMRSELEVPTSTSESKGHAQIKILADGTIESVVILNNKGDESVRFGHIHHLNPGQPTGPVIWWLSNPVGTDLNLTDRHLEFRQQGIFVTNAHFTSHEAALAELIRDPASFYVNFHSDNFPGGFARGFLP